MVKGREIREALASAGLSLLATPRQGDEQQPSSRWETKAEGESLASSRASGESKQPARSG